MKTIYLLSGLLCDDVVWRRQAEALRRRGDCEVRIVSFQNEDSISAMAATVLRDAPAEFLLAGHSMGGRVALEVYRQAAPRISRLALLDTGYEAAVAGEPQQRAVLVNQAQEQGIDAIAATWALPMLAPAHRHQPQLVQEMLQMVGRMSPQIYAGQTRALLGRPDATPVLATITCPTLILCGADDGWSPPERHARMVALVKGSNLLVIPACGHMSTMEQSDAVSQALLDWAA